MASPLTGRCGDLSEHIANRFGRRYASTPRPNSSVIIDKIASFSVGGKGAGDDLFGGLVEGALSKKLEIGGELAVGAIQGIGDLLSVHRRPVTDPGATEQTEDTVMYFIYLEIQRGGELLVRDTPFYSPLAYVPLLEVRAAFNNPSRTLWIPTNDSRNVEFSLPVDACTEGLCVEAMLQSLEDIIHPTEEQAAAMFYDSLPSRDDVTLERTLR